MTRTVAPPGEYWHLQTITSEVRSANEPGVGLGEVQHTICYNSINDRRRYWDGVTREPTGILGLMGPDMALPLPSVNQKLL